MINCLVDTKLLHLYLIYDLYLTYLHPSNHIKHSHNQIACFRAGLPCGSRYTLILSKFGTSSTNIDTKPDRVWTKCFFWYIKTNQLWGISESIPQEDAMTTELFETAAWQNQASFLESIVLACFPPWFLASLLETSIAIPAEVHFSDIEVLSILLLLPFITHESRALLNIK